MAGYSQRSLAQKLGFKEGQKVLFVAAPADYEKTLGPLPAGILARHATFAQVQAKAIAKAGPFDFAQCFCRETSELRSIFPALKNLLATQGMLWVSWPKRIKGSSANAAPAAVSFDPLTENQAREIGLKSGLVDIKVCAVDEIWSGLKFVVRLKDR